MTKTQDAARTQTSAHTQTLDRSRTFDWSDPLETAAALRTRDGLAAMRALAAGEFPAPPVWHLLGMGRMEVAEGQVTVEFEPREFHYNPLGSVHGGILATVLDTAAGCAVHTVLPAGHGYTSLDLTTKYLRPVMVRSGPLTCLGTVLSKGRRTALAEARLCDAEGRLLAHATSSCLIFPHTEAPAMTAEGPSPTDPQKIR